MRHCCTHHWCITTDDFSCVSHVHVFAVDVVRNTSRTLRCHAAHRWLTFEGSILMDHSPSGNTKQPYNGGNKTTSHCVLHAALILYDSSTICRGLCEALALPPACTLQHPSCLIMRRLDQCANHFIARAKLLPSRDHDLKQRKPLRRLCCE